MKTVGGWSRNERFQLSTGVQKRLLQNVVGPDAAINPAVEPEVDDPPQTGTLHIEQFGQGPLVAMDHAVNQLARLINRGVLTRHAHGLLARGHRTMTMPLWPIDR